MTSKALEAAVVVHTPGFRQLNTAARGKVRAEVSAIIRAFAQNLSLEAAEVGSNAAAKSLRELAESGQIENMATAERAGFIAAIEKDLE